MPHEPILIVGASRGIGAELARQYLAAGHPVHATVRNLDAPGLPADVGGNLTRHLLDVRDEDGVRELAAELAGADLGAVIHNAGINQGSRSELMQVNAVAPLRMVEALLDTGAVRRDGIVAILTSQMGARRGRKGSLGGYGDSKAALNDHFRMRAGDWRERGVIAIVIHPGWVQTDMGGAGAPVSVDDSAAGILRLLDGLTPDDHGRFWTWEGQEHPW